MTVTVNKQYVTPYYESGVYQDVNGVDFIVTILLPAGNVPVMLVSSN
jgi:hypothetical protein